VARYLFSDLVEMTVWTVSSTFASAAGAPAVFYTDSQALAVADLAEYVGATPLTPGGAIPNSTLTVNSYSQIPPFWGPDGVDTLYVQVAGGPVSEVRADRDHRLDVMEATLAALLEDEDLQLSSFLGGVADEPTMLALVGVPGNWTIRADTGTAWFLTAADATLLANWRELPTPGVVVTSVAGKVGTVSLDPVDVGLGNANNTSDAAKPISTAAQAALDLKAPIVSPTFTGTVSGVTSTMVGLGNVTNTSDANKPVSTAQATAIALKVTKGSEVHNVLDYGAVGNGTTDDTAAFQAALTATGWPTTRGSILVPPRVYNIAGTIQINGGGATSTPPLSISGPGATLRTVAVGNTIMNITNSIVSLTYVDIEGVFFAPNANPATGVALHNAELVRFTNCTFGSSFSTGASLTGVSNYNTFQNCTFANAARGLLLRDDCGYLSVIGCHFAEQLSGSPLNWIDQQSTGATVGIKIVGNTFYSTNATLPVIKMLNVNSTMIHGNNFDRSPLGAIQIGAGGSADGGTITGNTFIRTGNYHDIIADGAKNWVVAGNVFGVHTGLTAATYSNIRIRDPFTTSQGANWSIVGNNSTETTLLHFVDADASCPNVIATANTAVGDVTTAVRGGVIFGSATLDFPSIAAGGNAELTVTATGAASGDLVDLGPPAALEAGLIATARVSAANTVTIRLYNSTAGAVDPVSATWKVRVGK